jgi:hypothetical protein
MTMKKAMLERHTVRKYIDRPLGADTVSQLGRRLDECNSRYGLAVRLMREDSSAFGAITKLFVAKGARNFFLLAGSPTPDLDERLGYCGADLMLFSQALGLNTWWVSGSFNRRAMTALADGDRVIGVIAVGYGASQGKPHRSRKAEDVSVYSGIMPPWFKSGVEAALLAPTSFNKQAFTIKGKDDKVLITYAHGIFSHIDLGIVKYHFELGAGKENFEWAEELAADW